MQCNNIPLQSCAAKKDMTGGDVCGTNYLHAMHDNVRLGVVYVNQGTHINASQIATLQ